MKTKLRKCLDCSERFKKTESKKRKRCAPCAKKHQAEQSINLHREKMKDPEYRKKWNAYFLDWRTKKLASDPEYKERFDAENKASGLRQKKRRQEDPEYKKHIAAIQKAYHDKRMEDPEYRACEVARKREYQRKHYANDPEYRKKVSAAAKKHRLEDPEKAKAWCRRSYTKRVSTPEGREAHNKRLRDYHRERYNNDPEYRAKRLAQNKAARLKRKEAVK